MRRSLRVLAGVALAANVVAVAVALTIGRRPTGPTGPGGPWTLFECTLWIMIAELFVMAGYIACLLYCERGLPEENKSRCIDQCLRWFLWASLTVVLLYFVCLLGHFHF